jgi:hypothetical protein
MAGLSKRVRVERRRHFLVIPLLIISAEGQDSFREIAFYYYGLSEIKFISFPVYKFTF